MPIVHPVTPPVPPDAEAFGDDTVRRSLGASMLGVVLGLGFILVAWTLEAWVVFGSSVGLDPPFDLPIDRPEPGSSVMPVAISVPLLLGMVPMIVGGAIRFRRERRWLGSLPFPFAHEGYVATMASSASTSMELVLHFAAHVAPEAIEEVAQAHGVTATPRPDGPTTLLLTSPTFDNVRTSTRGFTTVDNGSLHRWFRRRAVPLLRELQRSQGLTAVEIVR